MFIYKLMNKMYDQIYNLKFLTILNFANTHPIVSIHNKSYFFSNVIMYINIFIFTYKDLSLVRLKIPFHYN